MFKSKRRKELEATELKYLSLLEEVNQLQLKCSDISPEIGHAMARLQGWEMHSMVSVDSFRKKLAQGELSVW